MPTTRYMRLKSKKPSDTGLVLVNGTVNTTAYTWDAEGLDAGAFGAPSWEVFYAMPYQGNPVKVGKRAKSREFALKFIVTGASAEAVGDNMETLMRMVADVNDHGGRLRYRPEGFDYPVEFEVLDIAVPSSSWSSAAETHDRQYITLTFTVDQYVYPDPLRVVDLFTADTFGTAGKYNNGGADWTATTGTLTNFAVSGGVLDAVNNLTTENIFTHTGTPYTYSDPCAFISFNRHGTTTFKLGVVLKYVNATNYIECYVDYSAGTPRLRVDVILAGVRTNRYTANQTDFVRQSIVCGMHGRHIFAGWAGGSSGGGQQRPWILSAFGANQRYSLSDAEALVFAGVLSRCSIVVNPQGTDTSINCVEFSDGCLAGGDTVSPANFRLSQSMQAAMDFMLEYDPGINYFEGFAFWNRTRPYNRVPIQAYSASWDHVFSAAAVTGVQTNAGTALAVNYDIPGDSPFMQSTLFGSAAATDAGMNYFVGDYFRKGRTYRFTATCKLQSGAGTIRAKLGVNTDVATGTAAALSSTWTTYTVDWTPTADRYGAYFALTCNAVQTYTATAVKIMVYPIDEGVPATYVGGNLPFGFIGSIAQTESGGALVSTADASAFGGGPMYQVTGATGVQGGNSWAIITHPLDEPGGVVEVDIWAMVKLQDTTTNPQIGLAVLNGFGTAFADSNGDIMQVAYPSSLQANSVVQWAPRVEPSAGVTARRFIYLGRVTLPCDGTDTVHYIETYFDQDGVAGIMGIDYLWGAPVNGYVGSITGCNSTEVKVTATDPKRINADGELFQSGHSSSTIQPGDGGLELTVLRGGLGGSRLELPAGSQLEMCALQATAVVPDVQDSVSASNAASFTQPMRVVMQPKHLIARS